MPAKPEFTIPEEPHSLWAATAAPAPAAPSLAGDARADVAIVGGGFTGLSAALHLAEAGADVRVLEAREVGWGASGRNNGQVIPGLKFDPDTLVAKLGPELGEGVVRTAGAAADLVFDLIRQHDIDCDARQAGWIQPAHTADALSLLRARMDQWQRRGADVAWLARDDLRARIGSAHYHGGWIDRRGGGIQPLGYARGLARAALAAGAKVHGTSPVQALERRDGHWQLTTPAGRLRANQVILATNGYTDGLWPGLAETVLPLYSIQIATAPLSDNVRRSFLADGEVLSDTRRLLWYYRQDAHGRLIMGGGGNATPAAARALAPGLAARIGRLLPQVEAPRIEFIWWGRIAMTADHVPHLNELAPGLWAGLGYNGRGIAMATMMGKILAARLLAKPDPEHDFPTSPAAGMPFYGLRKPVVGALRQWYRFRDSLES